MDVTIEAAAKSAEQRGDNTVDKVAACFFLMGDEKIRDHSMRGNDLSLLDDSISSRDGVSTNTFPLLHCSLR